MATWATIEQVAEWLGVPQDDRMQQALAAAQSAAQHVRPDLVGLEPYPAVVTYNGVDPSVDTVGPDVTLAVIKWAALMYRSRTSPQGFSTYEQFDTQSADYGSAIYEIRQLLGSRKPVAR